MTAAAPPVLDRSRQLVDPAMREAVDRLDSDVRLVAGYHLGYWDADGRPANGAGKGLRAALALLSAAAAGDPDSGVPAAVAVELVHGFSLLHDDVMDGDRERRHRPTAWAVFGAPAAILAGDAMVTLATEVLADASSPNRIWAIRCLTTTTRRLVAGQAADVAFERRDEVSLDECLEMARDKTGALLSCAASLGAVLADGPPELVLQLREYGGHLGLAFQLIDDMLGIWGDPRTTGKPVLSDLRARKKTLPVVAALTAGKPSSARLRELYLRPEPLTGDELRRAAQLVEEAGGRAWANAESSRQLAAALGRLDELDLPAEVRTEFAELARFVTGRDH